MDIIPKLYATLWQPIILPNRELYEIHELGSNSFTLENSRGYERTDFVVLNKNGQRLQCSHFEPRPMYRVMKNLPCVIYMHGNASCRLESLVLLNHLLPLNITIVAFDFSGCGLSDGEYVTLGHKEIDDLEAVISYLREKRNISTLALWGRSMGAVTAIKYASNDPSISCVVADSPFNSLEDLIKSLGQKYVPFIIPNFAMNFLINSIRQTIMMKCGMDIVKQNMDKVDLTAPLLLITAKDDTLVPPLHPLQIYKKFRTHSTLLEVEGDHNSSRSDIANQVGTLFIFESLKCKTMFDAANVSEDFRIVEKSLLSKKIMEKLRKRGNIYSECYTDSCLFK